MSLPAESGTFLSFQYTADSTILAPAAIAKNSPERESPGGAETTCGFQYTVPSPSPTGPSFSFRPSPINGAEADISPVHLSSAAAMARRRLDYVERGDGYGAKPSKPPTAATAAAAAAAMPSGSRLPSMEVQEGIEGDSRTTNLMGSSAVERRGLGARVLATAAAASSTTATAIDQRETLAVDTLSAPRRPSLVRATDGARPSRPVFATLLDNIGLSQMTPSQPTREEDGALAMGPGRCGGHEAMVGSAVTALQSARRQTTNEDAEVCSGDLEHDRKGRQQADAGEQCQRRRRPSSRCTAVGGAAATMYYARSPGSGCPISAAMGAAAKAARATAQSNEDESAAGGDVGLDLPEGLWSMSAIRAAGMLALESQDAASSAPPPFHALPPPGRETHDASAATTAITTPEPDACRRPSPQVPILPVSSTKIRCGGFAGATIDSAMPVTGEADGVVLADKARRSAGASLHTSRRSGHGAAAGLATDNADAPMVPPGVRFVETRAPSAEARRAGGGGGEGGSKHREGTVEEVTLDQEGRRGEKAIAHGPSCAGDVLRHRDSVDSSAREASPASCVSSFNLDLSTTPEHNRENAVERPQSTDRQLSLMPHLHDPSPPSPPPLGWGEAKPARDSTEFSLSSFCLASSPSQPNCDSFSSASRLTPPPPRPRPLGTVSSGSGQPCARSSSSNEKESRHSSTDRDGSSPLSLAMFSSVEVSPSPRKGDGCETAAAAAASAFAGVPLASHSLSLNAENRSPTSMDDRNHVSTTAPPKALLEHPPPAPEGAHDPVDATAGVVSLCKGVQPVRFQTEADVAPSRAARFPEGTGVIISEGQLIRGSSYQDRDEKEEGKDDEETVDARQSSVPSCLGNEVPPEAGRDRRFPGRAVPSASAVSPAHPLVNVQSTEACSIGENAGRTSRGTGSLTFAELYDDGTTTATFVACRGSRKISSRLAPSPPPTAGIVDGIRQAVLAAPPPSPSSDERPRARGAATEPDPPTGEGAQHSAGDRSILDRDGDVLADPRVATTENAAVESAPLSAKSSVVRSADSNDKPVFTKGAAQMGRTNWAAAVCGREESLTYLGEDKAVDGSGPAVAEVKASEVKAAAEATPAPVAVEVTRPCFAGQGSGALDGAATLEEGGSLSVADASGSAGQTVITSGDRTISTTRGTHSSTTKARGDDLARAHLREKPRPERETRWGRPSSSRAKQVVFTSEEEESPSSSLGVLTALHGSSPTPLFPWGSPENPRCNPQPLLAPAAICCGGGGDRAASSGRIAPAAQPSPASEATNKAEDEEGLKNEAEANADTNADGVMTEVDRHPGRLAEDSLSTEVAVAAVAEANAVVTTKITTVTITNTKFVGAAETSYKGESVGVSGASGHDRVAAHSARVEEEPRLSGQGTGTGPGTRPSKHPEVKSPSPTTATATADVAAKQTAPSEGWFMSRRHDCCSSAERPRQARTPEAGVRARGSPGRLSLLATDSAVRGGTEQDICRAAPPVPHSTSTSATLFRCGDFSAAAGESARAPAVAKEGGVSGIHEDGVGTLARAVAGLGGGERGRSSIARSEGNPGVVAALQNPPWGDDTLDEIEETPPSAEVAPRKKRLKARNLSVGAESLTVLALPQVDEKQDASEEEDGDDDSDGGPTEADDGDCDGDNSETPTLSDSPVKADPDQAYQEHREHLHHLQHQQQNPREEPLASRRAPGGNDVGAKGEGDDASDGDGDLDSNESETLTATEDSVMFDLAETDQDEQRHQHGGQPRHESHHQRGHEHQHEHQHEDQHRREDSTASATALSLERPAAAISPVCRMPDAGRDEGGGPTSTAADAASEANEHSEPCNGCRSETPTVPFSSSQSHSAKPPQRQQQQQQRQEQRTESVRVIPKLPYTASAVEVVATAAREEGEETDLSPELAGGASSPARVEDRAIEPTGWVTKEEVMYRDENHREDWEKGRDQREEKWKEGARDEAKGERTRTGIEGVKDDADSESTLEQDRAHGTGAGGGPDEYEGAGDAVCPSEEKRGAELGSSPRGEGRGGKAAGGAEVGAASASAMREEAARLAALSRFTAARDKNARLLIAKLKRAQSGGSQSDIRRIGAELVALRAQTFRYDPKSCTNSGTDPPPSGDEIGNSSTACNHTEPAKKSDVSLPISEPPPSNNRDAQLEAPTERRPQSSSLALAGKRSDDQEGALPPPTPPQRLPPSHLSTVACSTVGGRDLCPPGADGRPARAVQSTASGLPIDGGVIPGESPTAPATWIASEDHVRRSRRLPKRQGTVPICPSSDPRSPSGVAALDADRRGDTAPVTEADTADEVTKTMLFPTGANRLSDAGEKNPQTVHTAAAAAATVQAPRRDRDGRRNPTGDELNDPIFRAKLKAKAREERVGTEKAVGSGGGICLAAARAGGRRKHSARGKAGVSKGGREDGGGGGDGCGDREFSEWMSRRQDWSLGEVCGASEDVPSALAAGSVLSTRRRPSRAKLSPAATPTPTPTPPPQQQNQQQREKTTVSAAGRLGGRSSSHRSDGEASRSSKVEAAVFEPSVKDPEAVSQGRKVVSTTTAGKRLKRAKPDDEDREGGCGGCGGRRQPTAEADGRAGQGMGSDVGVGPRSHWKRRRGGAAAQARGRSCSSSCRGDQEAPVRAMTAVNTAISVPSALLPSTKRLSEKASGGGAAAKACRRKGGDTPTRKRHRVSVADAASITPAPKRSSHREGRRQQHRGDGGGSSVAKPPATVRQASASVELAELRADRGANQGHQEDATGSVTFLGFSFVLVGLPAEARREIQEAILTRGGRLIEEIPSKPWTESWFSTSTCSSFAVASAAPPPEVVIAPAAGTGTGASRAKRKRQSAEHPTTTTTSEEIFVAVSLPAASREPEYVLAIAMGIPLVHRLWIEDSAAQGRPLPAGRYLLPGAREISRRRQTVGGDGGRTTQRGVRSATARLAAMKVVTKPGIPLTGMSVGIAHLSPRTCERWARVLSTAGAQIVRRISAPLLLEDEDAANAEGVAARSKRSMPIDGVRPSERRRSQGGERVGGGKSERSSALRAALTGLDCVVCDYPGMWRDSFEDAGSGDAVVPGGRMDTDSSATPGMRLGRKRGLHSGRGDSTLGRAHSQSFHRLGGQGQGALSMLRRLVAVARCESIRVVSLSWAADCAVRGTRIKQQSRSEYLSPFLDIATGGRVPRVAAAADASSLIFAGATSERYRLSPTIAASIRPSRLRAFVARTSERYEVGDHVRYVAQGAATGDGNDCLRSGRSRENLAGREGHKVGGSSDVRMGRVVSLELAPSGRVFATLEPLRARRRASSPSSALVVIDADFALTTATASVKGEAVSRRGKRVVFDHPSMESSLPRGRTRRACELMRVAARGGAGGTSGHGIQKLEATCLRGRVCVLKVQEFDARSGYCGRDPDVFVQLPVPSLSLSSGSVL